MSKSSPISDIFPVDLSAAGSLDLSGVSVGYFHVWETVDASNGPVLDARLEASFGDANVRWIPCLYNSKIEFVPPVNLVKLRWQAQPGRTARIIVAENAEAFEANNAPTRQLVTSSIGASGAHANVLVNSTPAIVAPANTLRQSLALQNRGTAPAFIGFSNVALPASGWELPVGGSLVIDKTTAAIWAATSSGTADIRTLTELS